MTYIPCPHTPACHALTYCAHTEVFVAGWNMPGCLPDSTPEEFDSTVEAWEYLIEEIERCAEEMAQMQVEGIEPSQVELDTMGFDTDEIDQTRTGSFLLGGLVYFVQRAEPGQ